MEIRPTADKRKILTEQLELGMVLVALDARLEPVDVPAHLRHDVQLRLNLSYRFGLPLELDDWGITATLTFGGDSHDCRIPWTAIFLLVSHVSGQPYLFPDDIPTELLAQASSLSGDDNLIGHAPIPATMAAPPAARRRRNERPALRLVTSEANDGDAASGDDNQPATATPPASADAAPKARPAGSSGRRRQNLAAAPEPGAAASGSAQAGNADVPGPADETALPIDAPALAHQVPTSSANPPSTTLEPSAAKPAPRAVPQRKRRTERQSQAASPPADTAPADAKAPDGSPIATPSTGAAPAAAPSGDAPTMGSDESDMAVPQPATVAANSATSTAEPVPPATTPEPVPPVTGRRRGHLRLVK